MVTCVLLSILINKGCGFEVKMARYLAEFV